jgi:hypothetical protein
MVTFSYTKREFRKISEEVVTIRPGPSNGRVNFKRVGRTAIEAKSRVDRIVREMVQKGFTPSLYQGSGVSHYWPYAIRLHKHVPLCVATNLAGYK